MIYGSDARKDCLFQGVHLSRRLTNWSIIEKLPLMIGAMDRNKRLKLPPEVLLEIEEALNFPQFLEMSVGATLTDVLTVALYNAKRVWNWRARAADSIRYFFQRFHQNSFSSKDFSQYRGRLVLTWLFDREDLKGFVLPLLEKYGYDNTVVLGPLASMRAKLPHEAHFVLWGDFPKIDMKVWRKEFNRCQPTWRRRLNQVLEKHSVPLYVGELLVNRLQIQTKRIMAAGRFLDVVEPKVIVTEYDRNGHSSCLVLAARQRGIPAITMIHAAGLEPYPSYGFAPFLARYACCWGEQHKQNLLAHGVADQQLVVTGCQALLRELEVKRDSARLKIGLALDKPAVLLATSPIKLEDRKKYTLVFCAAMSKLPELSAIVRLHPAENIAEYQNLVDEFPKVMFLSNNSMSRDESLAAADIVVNHESSFGVDAILKGKLVVIIDIPSTPLKIGKELIERAGCPVAKGEDELVSVIRKIFVDDTWRKELQAKAAQYALQICESFGQDAVNKVSRVIDDAVKIRQKEASIMVSEQLGNWPS